MRKATLILGGGGFIGTCLRRLLDEHGKRVSVLSRGVDDARSEAFLRRRGSIEDSSMLRELLAEADAVVYLASVTTPGSSAREPGLEVTGNLLPLARFLEVAQQMPARPLVFVSSAGTVYGDGSAGADEAAALRPRSYYGAGKVASEAFLHSFALTAGWPTTVLRPSNVYGPGQLPLKGFAIVPTIFRHIQERRSFEVWGDGSTVRDYLFVDDLCDLLVRVLARPAQPFAVYNAGSGAAVSVLELVRHCETVAGEHLKTHQSPARVVDVRRSVPSVEAAASAFDWRATTPLDAGLRRTWQWLCQQATAG